MNNHYVEEIKKSITQSSLSIEAQQDLVNIFSAAPDDALALLVDFLRAHPEWVPKLYQNLLEKRAAFIANDSAAWRKIIETEEAQLKEIGA